MAVEKIEDTTLLSHESSKSPVLEPSNTVMSLPTAHLPQEADEVAQWIAAGERATAAAHTFLRAHGASIIYGCNGEVCEELPDGTVVVHPSGETPSTLHENTKQKVGTA